MKSDLLIASIFALSTIFMITGSDKPVYSKNCPRIKPVTRAERNLTVYDMVGEYHDAYRSNDTVPYVDASYCNNVNDTCVNSTMPDTKCIVTDFHAVNSTTLEHFNTIIQWFPNYNEAGPEGEPEGFCIDVVYGYYQKQRLFVLDFSSDKENGFYLAYACIDNGDGSLTQIVQFESRKCRPTLDEIQRIDDTLIRNNLDLTQLNLQFGTTENCVEYLNCEKQT